MRAVAIALLISLSSCNFAVKHPAVTAGIVGGTVALGSCELASGDQKACFVFSGSAALFLGLVVAGALWLGTYDEEAAPTTAPGQPAAPPPEPEPAPDHDLDPEPPPAPPVTPPVEPPPPPAPPVAPLQP
ncbi:MAG: hypothetical protein WKG01_18185 [Kofleriaceae bacterium]